MAIRVNLITGRTIQQGVSMEAGKEKPPTRLTCRIIEPTPTDFKNWEFSVARTRASRATTASVVREGDEATGVLTRHSIYSGCGSMGRW